MIKKSILAIFTFVLLVGFQQALRADASKVVILDRNKMMKESTALLGISEEINKKTDAVREEFLKKEARLKKKSEKLKEQREKLTRNEKGLSEEVWKKAFEKYRQDVISFQKVKKEQEQYFSIASQKGLKEVLLIAEEVVQSVMEEKKIEIVLWKSQVVASKEALDITDEVIVRLNKKLPKITKPIFGE